MNNSTIEHVDRTVLRIRYQNVDKTISISSSSLDGLIQGAMPLDRKFLICFEINTEYYGVVKYPFCSYRAIKLKKNKNGKPKRVPFLKTVEKIVCHGAPLFVQAHMVADMTPLKIEKLYESIEDVIDFAPEDVLKTFLERNSYD